MYGVHEFAVHSGDVNGYVIDILMVLMEGLV